ncbi:putative lipoprotein [Cellvibrio japonicus Ueda107]|uniref:Putative lipoprotein n=1 Tax=Cellvibrio japonicus (strain Ueda107) TaxID=498211 RepID=B3PB26_CELJU|nr:putative lipoprotein [Cellvibrio japonicus Ueda107]QEI11619.1 hypothetical protein FY117_04845 [Cellvibrio japonicus]QEI15193.1 hypothetical protein FY116_04845 [Cellvibrio japonicus]QEI18773.1 hypothetical protein FY115_04845 [Cellvibrio japonicus]
MSPIKIITIIATVFFVVACGGSGGSSGSGTSSSAQVISSVSSAINSSSSVTSSSSSSVSSLSSATVSSSSLSSISSSSSQLSSSSSVISSSSASSSSSDSSAPVRVESGLATRAANNSCHAPEIPPSALGNYSFEWVTVPSGVNDPIYLAQAPGVDDRYYVVERPGRIRSFVLGDANASLAVDFSSQVVTTGEGGALGLAFHPDFAANRYAYVFFTASRQTYNISDSNVSMVSVVRRYTVSSDGLSFTQPVDILAPLNASDTRLNQRWTNHKGGWIGFSPIDGYLYIALGDRGEGPGGVPLANNFAHIAQDVTSLHGKILRIDVDTGSPYGIPADNPFAHGGGAAEIFAWGFRNPWRSSFDRLTGDLWVGDVGEGEREEINKVVLGGNYGWPFREGNYDRCNNCVNGQQSLAPVVDLSHSDGWVAVIGGYVYRGAAMPELQGRYIFGDFIRSGVTTISYDNDGEPFAEDLVPSGGSSPGFSEDNAGNIWRIHSWGGFERLARTSAPAADNFPERLSETGCFEPQDIHTPVPGVVAYDINSPLWSDGAAKERYFALPNDTEISIQENHDWAFPIGSVLIKTFLLQGSPVETRLLVRHSNGQWAGYSYEWNDAGTDAVLLASGKTKWVAGQWWHYPSRAQCMNCHTAPNGNPAAERVLGLETAQINRDFIYPGNLIANQIQTLASVGYFAENPGAHGELVQMPNPLSTDGDPGTRARAYLHSNCANCHQPNGPGRGGMDFRYTTDWLAGHYCNQIPSFGNLGIADARLLKPGVAGESIIPLRMARTDAHRMPPLGVSIPDDQGIAVVEGWINSLSGCL